MSVYEIDQDAFSALIEPYRHDLQEHCYRMMGTVQDAEDMVQETFLRAWRRRDTSEGQATLRAWLYKIATNICLDALRKRPHRVVPMTYQAASRHTDPMPAAIREPIWLEPYPDELLISNYDSPEAHFATQENISLAFITALHLLPPRQRAVLILRDALDWEASEVADLLDTSVSSVKSALHRARTTLSTYDSVEKETGGPKLADAERQIMLDQFVHAWETADVNALVQLLKEDATFSMPPVPTWYRGWEAIREALTQNMFKEPSSTRWRLLLTRANRQPAFGLYLRQETDGVYHAAGIGVITFQGNQITDITIFINSPLVKHFALPAVLPTVV